MKIAVDVCISTRGITLLRDAGHEVVVEAEHGEGDRSWFRRALDADVEMILAADGDIEILAYDNNVRWFMHRQSQTGEETVQRFIDIYGRNR